MKRLLLVFLLILLVFLLYGLRRGSKEGFCHLTLIGSTSVQPFAERLAEEFMAENKGYLLDVQGGGSTAGIQAVRQDTAHIGMSSRELKGEERTLKSYLICYDALAVIVHPANPIENLSIREIREIYAGRKRSWREFGWKDRAIDVITREEGSGTRSSFEDLVMKGEEIAPTVMVQDSNGSVREIVANDPYAIGYISFGLVDRRVKAVSIDGVRPTEENIKRKVYRFVRPFLFITKGAPKACEQNFISFVLSERGQGILKREGLIPVL